MRRKTPRLALAALVVVTPFLAIAPPATAEDVVRPTVITEPVPSGFKTWGELFAVQEQMNSAAMAITTEAAKLSDSGLGTVIAAPENRHLKIFWKGAVPQSVQAVIDAERQTVPVKVLPAKYTKRELADAVGRLTANPEFGEVESMTDASGVLVRPRTGRSGDAKVRALASDPDVTVIIGEESHGRDFVSRNDDSPPHWAGGRTWDMTYGEPLCSTSFAIKKGSSYFLLYARHCMKGVDTPVYDGGQDLIGYESGADYEYDTAVISSSVALQGRVWDGPWNSSSYWKPVQGASPTNNGNWVCTSGSASGIRCGIQVLNIDVHVGTTGPFVSAYKTDGTNAVGEGDSGGPVFSLPSPDNGKVIAKGVISAGIQGYTTTCTGDLSFARTCYKRVLFADVSGELSRRGATIVTG